MTASSPRLSTATPPADQEISLVAIAAVVLRHRFLVLGIAFYLVLLVAVPLLLMPRKYTSQSSFMLQTRQNIPSNLTGLASQFGLTLPTSDAGQSPVFYAELLQSRQVLSALVDSPVTAMDGNRPRTAPLADWLRIEDRDSALRREKAIKALSRAIGANSSSKTGVVSLEVTTRYRDLSRVISARMLEWVNDFNLRKRQSQASEERKFTEGRLDEALRQLRDAEDRLLVFTQRNRETGSSPLLRLDQDRLTRDVAMRQQVYTSLVQAYDRTKIEEVRDTPVITVLQPPEAPVRPDPRGIVTKVLLALFFGLAVGVVIAMMRESLQPRTGVAQGPAAQLADALAEVRSDLRRPARAVTRTLTLR
jgi:uncharacterized protein involved in exopolysaccharide biosynthesis